MADKCKGCGNPIVWAKTVEGKPIPLDPRAHVYVVLKGENETPEARRMRSSKDDGVGYMVSHFQTCPKASEFGGGRASH